MFVGLIFAAALAPSPQWVAESRCNDVIATQLEDRARGDAAKAPAPNAREERLSDLQSIVTAADRERDVLQSVCPENDFAKESAHLEMVQSWAVVQQSAVAEALYAKRCPGNERAIAAGFLADGWLRLVRATTGGASPSVLVSKLRPTIVSRAAELGLVLPAPADTSNYWKDTVQNGGRTALNNCPQQ